MRDDGGRDAMRTRARLKRVARLCQALMSSATRAVLLSACAAPISASAQGMHDWGMWFETLIILLAVGALFVALIGVIRWLRR